MDTRKPEETSSEAQDKLSEYEAYVVEALKLGRDRDELELRLNSVKDFFGGIIAEFGEGRGVTIRLEESTPEDNDVPFSPGVKGDVVVEISEVRLVELVGPGQNESQDENDVVGFRLRYFIRPVSPAGNVIEAKRINNGQESTLWEREYDAHYSYKKDFPRPLWGSREDRERVGVLEFHWSRFPDHDPKALKKYEEGYLSKRKEQIENLEDSAERIREAVDNPLLNPWAPETRMHREADEEKEKQLGESVVASVVEPKKDSESIVRHLFNVRKPIN